MDGCSPWSILEVVLKQVNAVARGEAGGYGVRAAAEEVSGGDRGGGSEADYGSDAGGDPR